MILKLYKTEIRPEMNAVVESISKYLTESRKAYEWQNVKYTKPELDIMLKLPLDGHYNSLKQFDYAVLHDEQENRTYYYFVVNMDWKAKMTLRLQLSMDTLTTFWGPIREGLTQNTHVTRRYFDRWKRIGGTLYPLIDNHPEEITSPHMRRSKDVYVVGSTEHWTLVYMTEYSDAQTLSENPTVCLALPEKAHKLSGSVPDELVPSSFPNNTALCLDYAHTPNAKISHGIINFELKSDVDWAMLYFSTNTITLLRHDGNGDTVDDIPSVGISKTNVVYKQPSDYTTSAPHKYWQWDNPVYFSGAQLNPFSTWYRQFKTDPRLIKIIELPYAPFDYEEVDGIFQVPRGWEADSYGALRLIDADVVKFQSSVHSYNSLGPQTIAYSTISATDEAEPLLHETKLWNSSYHTYKFIYDNNVHALRLEDYTHPGANPSYGVDITFTASTGMDNSMLFKFDSNQVEDADFGEFMVCNRSTEVPYYTNEYLNYLRYGKAVDEKNKVYSIASTAVGGVGSVAQTSSSLAFALAGANIGGLTGGIGLAIGAGVGLISGLIATSASIYKANEQINAKIDQYTHQSSGVSAATDLSIFKEYGKNKLLLAAYEPTHELKEAIGRYFQLYGYSCDEYGVPNWNTRIWSDYFVMEPEFNSDVIFKDYETDIATRMKSGFRVLHYYQDARPAGPIDFESRHENWERSFLQ